MEQNPNIKKIGVYIQPTIPMHITDEVSFLEMLLAFQAKLNEVIEGFNNIQNTWEEYTDNAIAEFKIYVDEQDVKLGESITAVNDRLTQINADLLALIEETKQYIIKYSDDKNNELEGRLLELINRKYINPWTNQEDELQNILWSAFYGISGTLNSLTVDAYDALAKTVDEYELLAKSVINYTTWDGA